MENEMKTHRCKFICRRVTAGAHIVLPYDMFYANDSENITVTLILHFQFSIWQRKNPLKSGFLFIMRESSRPSPRLRD